MRRAIGLFNQIVSLDRFVKAGSHSRVIRQQVKPPHQPAEYCGNSVIQINQWVVIHRDPFGRDRVFRRSDKIFLGVLVPLLKSAKRIPIVERVGKPQTEAGDRESKRPHFSVLSMRAFGSATPLFADELIHAGVGIMKRVLAIIHNREAVIIFFVTRRIQV